MDKPYKLLHFSTLCKLDLTQSVGCKEEESELLTET